MCVWVRGEEGRGGGERERERVLLTNYSLTAKCDFYKFKRIGKEIKKYHKGSQNIHSKH